MSESSLPSLCLGFLVCKAEWGITVAQAPPRSAELGMAAVDTESVHGASSSVPLWRIIDAVFLGMQALLIEATSLYQEQISPG